MIDVRLQYPYTARKLVVSTLMELPIDFRPTEARTGEDSPAFKMKNDVRFLKYIEERDLGFFLKAPKALYDLSFAGQKPIILSCSLSAPISKVREFMAHMGQAKPIFGYACDEAEVMKKNRMTIKIGKNSIESWVGRDTANYIPGLYWITIISSPELENHRVSVSEIESLALEHIDIDGVTHLFRFYSTPDGWISPEGQVTIRASFPCMFDIEKVRAQSIGVRSVQEWVQISHAWR